MAKLAETTYRDVNIGLANQFGAFAARNGIDVYQVIEASNSQPYSHIHRPGIAVGGHCIPVYPRLYLWNDPDATVVKRRARGKCGDARIHGRARGGGRRWRPHRQAGRRARGRVPGGVKETAFSGVFATVDALLSRGSPVLVHDPMYSVEELAAFGWEAYELGTAIDVVVVQADHAAYRDLGARRRAWRLRGRRWPPGAGPGTVPRYPLPCRRPGRGALTHGVRVVESADVAESASIGEGSSVWHLAQVRENAVLGENCIIGRGAYVGTGVRMGDNCKLQNYALVYEPTVLEDGVFVGPAVVFTNDHFPGRSRRTGRPSAETTGTPSA